MKFNCGGYSVFLETDTEDGFWMELSAIAPNGIDASNVGTINGIMGNILSEEQIESGRFDDEPWEFRDEAELTLAYKWAEKLFGEDPKYVAGCLDKDYVEGGWNFPSEKEAK